MNFKCNFNLKVKKQQHLNYKLHSSHTAQISVFVITGVFMIGSLKWSLAHNNYPSGSPQFPMLADLTTSIIEAFSLPHKEDYNRRIISQLDMADWYGHSFHNFIFIKEWHLTMVPCILERKRKCYIRWQLCVFDSLQFLNILFEWAILKY